MKQEEQLKHLFDLARKEPVQTSVNDVKKWIGMGAFAIALTALLSQLKIGLTKSVIMYTSIASIIGFGVTALVISNSKSEVKEVTFFQKTSEHKVNYSASEEIAEMPILEQSIVDRTVESKPILQEVFEKTIDFPTLKSYLPIPNFDKQLLQSAPIVYQSNLKTLNPFTDLTVGGLFTLILIQGDEYSYRAEGDYTADDLKISWETKNPNKLYIIYNSKKDTGEEKRRKKKGVVDDTNVDNLTLYLTFKSLDRIKIGGIVKTTTQGVIEGEKLKIEVGGASQFATNIQVKDLDIHVDGITLTTIAGQTNNLKVKGQGASELDFKEPLNLGVTEIKLDGLSKLDVNANMTALELKMEGASELTLEGNASKGKMDLNGTSILDAKEFNTGEIVLKMSGAPKASIKANDQADFELSGISSLDLNGQFVSFKANLSGASTVKSEGTIDQMHLLSSGTSTFKGTKLSIQEAKVMLEGASSASLDVKNELKITVSGTSTAKLLSEPTSIQEIILGAARISRK